MFTGIIETLGVVHRIHSEGKGVRLVIQSMLPLDQVKSGDSIACDGVCLTVERAYDEVFEVTAGQETLACTTWGSVKEGHVVHIERALLAGSRLDGHLVQGHVDGIGRVKRSYGAQESWILWVDVGPALSRYVATKGSLCVDGVSLTVNELDGHAARLNIIPHTARHTKLTTLGPGSRVNIEVDVLARYVERMLGAGSAPQESRLRAWLEEEPRE